MLGPSRATATMEKGKVGMDNATSVIRISTSSTQPPKYPDSTPNKVEIKPTAIAATKPTNSATRNPCRNWLSTSLPKAVVPNKCSPEGGRKRARRPVSVIIALNGSKGAR